MAPFPDRSRHLTPPPTLPQIGASLTARRGDTRQREMPIPVRGRTANCLPVGRARDERYVRSRAGYSRIDVNGFSEAADVELPGALAEDPALSRRVDACRRRRLAQHRPSWPTTRSAPSWRGTAAACTCGPSTTTAAAPAASRCSKPTSHARHGGIRRLGPSTPAGSSCTSTPAPALDQRSSSSTSRDAAAGSARPGTVAPTSSRTESTAGRAAAHRGRHRGRRLLHRRSTTPGPGRRAARAARFQRSCARRLLLTQAHSRRRVGAATSRPPRATAPLTAKR